MSANNGAFTSMINRLVVATLCCGVGLSLVTFNAFAMEAKQLSSLKIDGAPTIDGSAEEGFWESSTSILTYDKIAGITIELRSVHNGENIFFLVRYPDATESRQHKYLVWDDALKAYRSGPKREDSFVFKWNMETRPVELSISGDDAYKADVWYWKANRTDPVGYADDKFHSYGHESLGNSLLVINKTGKPFFLERLGDGGKATYLSMTYDRYSTPEVPRYHIRQPTGSRADIRAKGNWKNGVWTIEWARKLKTGHTDDVQLETGKVYSFGVSRFEIAGKAANPGIDQPNYESGEITELLELKIE